MKKELKYLKTFEQNTDKNLNISDVISRFIKQKSFSYNIPQNKLYMNIDKGKLFIYKFGENDYLEMLEYIDLNDL